jgi:hypothetical protein
MKELPAEETLSNLPVKPKFREGGPMSEFAMRGAAVKRSCERTIPLQELYSTLSPCSAPERELQSARQTLPNVPAIIRCSSYLTFNEIS